MRGAMCSHVICGSSKKFGEVDGSAEAHQYAGCVWHDTQRLYYLDLQQATSSRSACYPYTRRQDVVSLVSVIKHGSICETIEITTTSSPNGFQEILIFCIISRFQTQATGRPQDMPELRHRIHSNTSHKCNAELGHLECVAC